MTDKPKRARDPNAKLSIGAAFDRIDKLRRTRTQRIAVVVANMAEAEREKELAIIARVGHADRDRLMSILGADPDEPQAASSLSETDDSTPDSEPLPRGASDYRPGPAAEAARGKR